MADFQRAISLDPEDTGAYKCRTRIWKAREHYDLVVADFAELARMAPDDPIGHRELARVLATCKQPAIRDGQRAVQEASIACELTKWQDLDGLDTLAAACAETRDFDAAVKWQARAIELHLARNRGVDPLINVREEADLKYRLSLYNRRLPYHE